VILSPTIPEKVGAGDNWQTSAAHEV